MESKSSLSRSKVAGPECGLAAAAPIPAEPGDNPTVGDRPAPGASPRLFIVHAPEDAWFVDGFLLEAMRLPEGDVLISSKLELGAVIVHEIERGALSPVTVVVVSPAFRASPW